MDFRERIHLVNLRSVISERLLKLQRFRSKLVCHAGGGGWQFAPLQFDSIPMDTMVREVAHVKSMEEMEAFASELYAQPWSAELPAWRAYVLNAMDDGKSRVLWCVDHAIADGNGLVDILLGILDKYDTAMKPAQSGSRRAMYEKPGCLKGLMLYVRAFWNVCIGDQLADTENRLKSKARDLAAAQKKVTMSDPIPLGKVKEVQAKFPGASVHEVLLAHVSLALRSYFEAYDPSVLKRKPRITGTLPINLRGLVAGGSVDKERNLFAVARFTFPVHLADLGDVMANISKQMEVLRASPEPLWRDKVLRKVANMIPTKAVPGILEMTAKRITLVFSNVAGPSQEVLFDGQPIEDLAFYSLLNTGLSLGMFSYNGMIRTSFSLDSNAEETQPKRLTVCFARAFEALHAAALAQP